MAPTIMAHAVMCQEQQLHGHSATSCGMHSLRGEAVASVLEVLGVCELLFVALGLMHMYMV